MEENELLNCIRDMQEVQAGLYKKIEIIAACATETKVNAEVTLQEIKLLAPVLGNISGPESVSLNLGALKQLEQKIDRSIHETRSVAASFQSAIKQIPERVRAQVSVRFEGRNKVISLVLVAAILLIAISIGLWVSTWQQNRRLRENDLKYRFLMLKIPTTTFQVDTLYRHNPQSFETHLKLIWEQWRKAKGYKKWPKQTLRKKEKKHKKQERRPVS